MEEDEIEVTDDNKDSLFVALIGKRIVSIEREPDSKESFQHGENSVRITLDDGSSLYFMGFGYDASGLTTFYAKGRL